MWRTRVSPVSGLSYATAALTMGISFKASRLFEKPETSATLSFYSMILVTWLTPQLSVWLSDLNWQNRISFSLWLFMEAILDICNNATFLTAGLLPETYAAILLLLKAWPILCIVTWLLNVFPLKWEQCILEIDKSYCWDTIWLDIVLSSEHGCYWSCCLKSLALAVHVIALWMREVLPFLMAHPKIGWLRCYLYYLVLGFCLFHDCQYYCLC